MTGDEALAEAVKRDYRTAGVDAKTRALLDFAVAATREARSVGAGTIDGLRGLGWSDEEILTAAHVAGFFNYYTRLVDALGVESEDFMTGGRS